MRTTSQSRLNSSALTAARLASRYGEASEPRAALLLVLVLVLVLVPGIGPSAVELEVEVEVKAPLPADGVVHVDTKGRVSMWSL
jgi:hypothetical protein